MRSINLLLVRTFIIILSFTVIPENSFAQWIQTNGPGGGNISAIASNDTYLFASTGAAFGYGAGVFRSSDNGLTWDILNTLVPVKNREFKNITALSVSGTYVAAATSNGVVFISSDNGDTWITTMRSKVVTIVSDGTKFIAGTDGDGIYSLDFGSTFWLPLNTGLTAEHITSIAIDGSTLYATASYVPLSISTDLGANWTTVTLPGTVFNAFSAALIDGNLYVGAQNGVHVSTNNGTTWTGPIPGITVSVYAFAKAGSNILTGGSGGLYTAGSPAGSWTLVSNKYNVKSFLSTGAGLFLAAQNSFAGNGGGIFLSTNNGTSWEDRTTGLPGTTVHGLALNGDAILAITPGNGLFSSTDKGETWVLLTPNAKSYDATLQTILVTDGKIFARSENGYLLSTDNGSTWTSKNPGFIPQAFYSYKSKIFIGEGSGIRISTDGGATWNQSNTGLTGYLSTNCFGAKGDKLFAGLYSEGVFVSTDDGASWTASNTGLTNLRVRSFAFLSGNIYAGTDNGGVFISTDDGSTWAASNTGLSSTNIWSLEVSGSSIFVASNDGVHISSDSGKTWQSTSPWPVITNTILAAGTDIYAGTLANGVWRYSTVTGIETNSQIMPEDFLLNQNYPNPFNPSTTISYNIPVQQKVSLKVYNVLGKEVAELINEEQGAGTHYVKFNAAQFSSGVYFYRLITDKFSEVKSMILLK